MTRQAIMAMAFLSFSAFGASESQPPSDQTQGDGTTPKTIVFDGVAYRLASATTLSATTTNEYIPEGESLSSWTTLLAVRSFRGSVQVNEALSIYTDTIKPTLLAKPEFFAKKGIDASLDVTLEMYLGDPDGKYVEYNLHRFYKTQNGVTTIQFAQKIPLVDGKLDLKPAKARFPMRLKEIADASYELQEGP